MTPECASAWNNYRITTSPALLGVYSAFEAAWKAATIAAVNAAVNTRSAAGHVLAKQTQSAVDPPKPPLCWICGKPLPHDCVGSAHEQPCWHEAWNGGPHGAKLSEVAILVQSWLNKQGHERCWYYPELFNHLAAALGLKATVAPGLPPRQEFERGCDRYQAEQYGNAQTDPTHGPPQSQQGQSQAQPANSFAALNAPVRKWPIGTPADDHYNLAWGFRLQQARAHRGLTLDALGTKLTPLRTRKDISAMEHGRRGLSVELCAELAQALDCDRCWLAGWKEGER